MARKLEMDTVGFLMMAHMNSAEGLVKQAKLMESYGANCIYVTDSAGHMLPDGVKERLAAVRAALKPETELGFHGHHNWRWALPIRSPPLKSAPTALMRPPPGWAPGPAIRRWKS
jgi:isopropylmalate/homocitrate/citramalate synthase